MIETVLNKNFEIKFMFTERGLIPLDIDIIRRHFEVKNQIEINISSGILKRKKGKVEPIFLCGDKKCITVIITTSDYNIIKCECIRPCLNPKNGDIIELCGYIIKYV